LPPPFVEEGEEEQLRFCMEPAEPPDFLFNGAPARSEPSILLPLTGEAEFTIICVCLTRSTTLAAPNIHRITKNLDRIANPKILSTIFKLQKIELFAGKKNETQKT